MHPSNPTASMRHMQLRPEATYLPHQRDIAEAISLLDSLHDVKALLQNLYGEDAFLQPEIRKLVRSSPLWNEGWRACRDIMPVKQMQDLFPPRDIMVTDISDANVAKAVRVIQKESNRVGAECATAWLHASAAISVLFGLGVLFVDMTMPNYGGSNGSPAVAASKTSVDYAAQGLALMAIPAFLGALFVTERMAGRYTEATCRAIGTRTAAINLRPECAFLSNAQRSRLQACVYKQQAAAAVWAAAFGLSAIVSATCAVMPGVAIANVVDLRTGTKHSAFIGAALYGACMVGLDLTRPIFLRGTGLVDDGIFRQKNFFLTPENNVFREAMTVQDAAYHRHIDRVVEMNRMAGFAP
ncbi:MAG: hypothetical protein EOO38_08090 [Cytophagaceae bacterium]|nr:MAG: hypothetical protein EOO38_08090 [Cytophagaceae bacterium]